MLGKQKCKILKEIRQKIADENDIPYVTRECTHKGECRGTCPSCESELRYLERELAARQSLGKRVAVAALCAGLAFSSVGCDLKSDDKAKVLHTAGVPVPTSRPPRRTPSTEPEPSPEDMIDGYVPYDEALTDPVDAAVPPAVSSSVPAVTVKLPWDAPSVRRRVPPFSS